MCTLSEVIGVVLIIVGILLILLGVLVWLGVVKPVNKDRHVQKSTSLLDLLMALLEKAPWVVAVGLILVFLGVVLLGFDLPF